MRPPPWRTFPTAHRWRWRVRPFRQPLRLINVVLVRGATGFSAVSINCGVDDWGLGVVPGAGLSRKMTASHVGENKEFARRYLGGELELELTPQGTLAEKLRAGGSGIAAFYTRTVVGTQVTEGGLPQIHDAQGNVTQASEPKEVRSFELGTKVSDFVLEEAITTDYALVHAAKGDRHGKLVFNKAARRFSPVAAMAGRICIAQVEELVEPGRIDPDAVHPPGVYVHRNIEVGRGIDKRIEKLMVRPNPAPAAEAIPAPAAKETKPWH